MAYQNWSVVAGEQPTTAKWNILGDNDASFNDGTGIGDGVIKARHYAAGSVDGAALNSENSEFITWRPNSNYGGTSDTFETWGGGDTSKAVNIPDWANSMIVVTTIPAVNVVTNDRTFFFRLDLDGTKGDQQEHEFRQSGVESPTVAWAQEFDVSSISGSKTLSIEYRGESGSSGSLRVIEETTLSYDVRYFD